jgi:hypothetical protein
MKTKLYTSVIIALLVAGIALAMPVSTVQAWGWRSVSKKPFTDTGGYMYAFLGIEGIKEWDDYVLEKHTFIFYAWAEWADGGYEGYNHNTMYWLWTGEPFVDGKMWGTRIIRDGPEPTDTAIGHGYITGQFVDGVMTWKAVDFFRAGYTTVSWQKLSGVPDPPTELGGFVIET